MKIFLQLLPRHISIDFYHKVKLDDSVKLAIKIVA